MVTFRSLEHTAQPKCFPFLPNRRDFWVLLPKLTSQGGKRPAVGRNVISISSTFTIQEIGGFRSPFIASQQLYLSPGVPLASGTPGCTVSLCSAGEESLARSLVNATVGYTVSLSPVGTNNAPYINVRQLLGNCPKSWTTRLRSLQIYYFQCKWLVKILK